MITLYPSSDYMNNQYTPSFSTLPQTLQGCRMTFVRFGGCFYMGLSVEDQRQKVRNLRPKEPAQTNKKSKWSRNRVDNSSIDALRKLAEDRVLELYHDPTRSEQQLIALLERHKIPFVFQQLFIKGMQFYIVDFFISGLIIEVDGKSHNKTKQKDAARTKWLLKRKEVKKVIRFKNNEVFDSPMRVVGTVLDAMKKLKIKEAD